jgi:hypothetical protein
VLPEYSAFPEGNRSSHTPLAMPSMNFEHEPELEWSFGYGFALALMAGAGGHGWF